MQTIASQKLEETLYLNHIRENNSNKLKGIVETQIFLGKNINAVLVCPWLLEMQVKFLNETRTSH